MNHLYKAHHITLHVRESNKPAISLYRDNLGFEQTGVEKGYCESQHPLLSLSFSGSRRENCYDFRRREEECEQEQMEDSTVG
jgi:ribosomal protein S18 acetylase RimI-like enzyme